MTKTTTTMTTTPTTLTTPTPILMTTTTTTSMVTATTMSSSNVAAAAAIVQSISFMPMIYMITRSTNSVAACCIQNKVCYCHTYNCYCCYKRHVQLNSTAVATNVFIKSPANFVNNFNVEQFFEQINIKKFEMTKDLNNNDSNDSNNNYNNNANIKDNNDNNDNNNTNNNNNNKNDHDDDDNKDININTTTNIDSNKLTKNKTNIPNNNKLSTIQRIKYMLDMDGFIVNRKFLIKEVGIGNMHTMHVDLYYFKVGRYTNLSMRDRYQINWVRKHVHGLYFRDYPDDYDITYMYELLYDLCLECEANGWLIGYKGGHHEYDILTSLGFAHLCYNIEHLGCPKIEKLLENFKFSNVWSTSMSQACTRHSKMQQTLKMHHCPKIEVGYFMTYLKSLMHV